MIMHTPNSKPAGLVTGNHWFLYSQILWVRNSDRANWEWLQPRHKSLYGEDLQLGHRNSWSLLHSRVQYLGWHDSKTEVNWHHWPHPQYVAFPGGLGTSQHGGPWAGRLLTRQLRVPRHCVLMSAVKAPWPFLIKLQQARSIVCHILLTKATGAHPESRDGGIYAS